MKLKTAIQLLAKLTLWVENTWVPGEAATCLSMLHLYSKNKFKKPWKQREAAWKILNSVIMGWKCGRPINSKQVIIYGKDK